MTEKTVLAELQQLTWAQLVALATQKNVVPFKEATEMDKDALVSKLAEVDGVLTPVQA
jgi:hypothetical protein